MVFDAKISAVYNITTTKSFTTNRKMMIADDQWTQRQHTDTAQCAALVLRLSLWAVFLQFSIGVFADDAAVGCYYASPLLGIATGVTGIMASTAFKRRVNWAGVDIATIVFLDIALSQSDLPPDVQRLGQDGGATAVLLLRIAETLCFATCANRYIRYEEQDAHPSPTSLWMKTWLLLVLFCAGFSLVSGTGMPVCLPAPYFVGALLMCSTLFIPVLGKIQVVL